MLERILHEDGNTTFKRTLRTALPYVKALIVAACVSQPLGYFQTRLDIHNIEVKSGVNDSIDFCNRLYDTTNSGFYRIIMIGPNKAVVDYLNQHGAELK